MRHDATGVPTLLLAALVASCAPQSPGAGDDSAGAPAAAAEWLREEGRERGLVFDHVSGHRQEYLMPEIMGGGAALFDMDSDGDLDAYLVQGGSLHPDAGPNPPNRLFSNRGDGTFVDVTASNGAGDRGYGMGVACGDVEGDGDVDLYVTNVGPNALYLNDGAGRFVDGTERAGVGHPGWGTSAAFLDLEGDGDLDLYVCNYLNWRRTNELPCKNNMGAPDYCSPRNYESPATDVVYRNNGDGTFEEFSEEFGSAARPGTGLGVACADFDGDGRLEVFVANDAMPDFLWVPGADGWREAGLLRGCALDGDGLAKAGMGVAVEDADGDGDPDLVVCNLNRESDSYYSNQGAYFVDRTAAIGLGAAGRAFTRFGLGWADLDQDGRPDLYAANGRVMRQSHTWAEDPYAEPNLLYRGRDDGRLELVHPRGGTSRSHAATSRAAAFGDVDGDGAVDVLVANRDGPAQLFRNVVAERGRWLLIDPRDGAGTTLHARVSLRIGEREVVREARAASSYQASNDPRVHFGLGAEDRARAVEVTWPDGTLEGFGDLAAGRVHVLRRGTGEPAAR